MSVQQRARAACEGYSDGTQYFCLAITYDKLGRRADAEDMLARMRTSMGDIPAAWYAMIFAQWGDIPRALDRLEVAMEQRDPALEFVKTGVIFDPLRGEPRFRAIEKALKFPD